MNVSCAFSGMPISNGCPVRWFLLTECPDRLSLPWLLRTWPLEATYDGDGTIRDVRSSDAMVSSVTAGFAVDYLPNVQSDRLDFPGIVEAAFCCQLRVDGNALRRASYRTDPGRQSRNIDVEPLWVEQAMVREDVWQALLNMSVTFGEDFVDIEACRAAARNLLARPRPKTVMEDLDYEREARQHVGTALLHVGFLTWDNGLREHARRLGSDLDSNVLAEFSFLWRLMQMSSYIWTPSYPVPTVRPKHRANILDVLSAVATNVADEDDADR